MLITRERALREVPRHVRTLAVLDAVVLLAGVFAAVTYIDDTSTGGEPSNDSAVRTTVSESSEAEAAAETSPPPIIAATPEAVARAAATTATLPARFEMTLHFIHESWADSDVPRRAASVTGMVDGDRRHYEMAGHDFLTAPGDPYDYTPLIVRPAREAATIDSGSLSTTILGSEAYQCGLSPDGRCTTVHGWTSVMAEHRRLSDTVLANAAVMVVPVPHLLSLTGVTDVESVGRDEVQGAPVQHLRGTFTMWHALENSSADAARDLRWWFSGLVGDDSVVDAMSHQPFPFDVWIDEQQRVRRLSITLLHDVRQFVAKGKSIELSFLDDPAAHVATIALGLTDFGATFEAPPPPTDTYVFPEPTRWVDPQYTGPIDAQKAAEEFEDLIGGG